MIQQKIIIPNNLGLHARAAAKLVALAGRFLSSIEIIKDEKTVNAKSIMGVMMLAATKGTEIELLIDGEDEKEAMESILALINDRFGEEQ